MCVWRCMSAYHGSWVRLEDNTQKQALSFPHVGGGDQAHVIRLCGRRHCMGPVKVFFDNCILHTLPSCTLWVWLQGWDNGLPVSVCLLTHRAQWSPVVSQIAEVHLFVSEQCPIEYALHAFLVTNWWLPHLFLFLAIMGSFVMSKEMQMVFLPYWFQFLWICPFLWVN